MLLPISNNEYYCYFIVTVIHAFFGLYVIYTTSKWYIYESGHISIESSSYKKWIGDWNYDNKDTEWYSTKYDILPTLKFYLIHNILWKIFYKIFNPKLANILFGPISAILIFYYIDNSKIFTVLIILAIFIISISYFIRIEFFAWIICCYFIIDPRIQNHLNIFHISYFYRQFNFYTYTIVKIINVSIYFSRNKEIKISFKLFSRIILYLFYLPYSSILIVLFDDFNNQLDNLENKNQFISIKQYIKNVIIGGFRLTLWFLITEIFLHIFCVNEIQYLSSETFFNLNAHVLFVIGIFKGAFFYLKYLFIFGLPIYFAKLDGMIPPRKPICIFTIVRFSNLWRGFDRGLYQFMLRQIYIPFLQINSKYNFLKFICAFLMPFVFVLVWHGTSTKYLIWVTCSLVDLFGEKIGRIFGESQKWKNITEYIGYKNAYRIKAIACIFTLIPGLFGVFSFLIQDGNAEKIAYKILVQGTLQIFTGEWKNSILSPGFCLLYLLTFGYFYSHTCLYFEEKEKIKRKRKLND
ncbi:Protein-cysteine N-palmitoyltransferase Rasp [Strongyloides ratti]|uniref:Protein-cysteine N-palmitoyltransferase Rasp n=1 Tax=Strongyloides ratti TaxID=34506 RepID=A0A090MP84_STRRB|nr:Protein-cysteine N-palmitoyltransferase Rasp [Strongyloides ratti]CEF59906.1 Protein-cysteine N-palmitoyltransferase Rasp [Strongyloides ratti]